MAKREVEQWITINGVHVPVFKGESKADAAKNFKEKVGKRNASQPITQKGKANAKKEYTNARNAAHNASEDKKEKADARFDKAKQKYTEAKEKKVVKSATRTSDKPTQAGKNDDVIQEIRYKGEISRKDKNGEWKVVGHYDNNKQAKTSTDNVTAAKTHQDLTDKLSKNGLKLDAADAHTMENSNSLNGEKVTMYDKDGNEYRGTYNKYSDGGREIVNIKKTADSPRKIANDNEDLKEKQIARNKTEADSLSGKSDYIVSKNSEGQELKIPRKTYEDRLERLKQYKQGLYDTANRPNSRYKLDPHHLRKVDDQIKDIENKLKAGRDESTPEYKQKTKEIKQYMEEHDTGLPAAKEHYDYMHPDEKAIERMGKELHAKNSKEINDTINKMIDNGTSWNDAVRIAHKQYIGDKKEAKTVPHNYGKEPSAAEYGKFMTQANRNASTDGFKVVHNNVGWSGAHVTTPSGEKLSVVNTGGTWRKEYTIYEGSKGYSTKKYTDQKFESQEAAIEYLKKKKR